MVAMCTLHMYIMIELNVNNEQVGPSPLSILKLDALRDNKTELYVLLAYS